MRSIMSGVANVVVDGLDKAFVLKKDLGTMLGVNIPLMCFNDSKKLLYAVTEGQKILKRG